MNDVELIEMMKEAAKTVIETRSYIDFQAAATSMLCAMRINRSAPYRLF